MKNIYDTRETEDTPQKTTCEEHPEVANFVENILDLEETEDNMLPELRPLCGIFISSHV